MNTRYKSKISIKNPQNDSHKEQLVMKLMQIGLQEDWLNKMSVSDLQKMTIQFL